MDSALVSRALRYDYLILVPVVAVAFNLWLIVARRWREWAVFNVAGLVNVGAELLMMRSGVRQFDTDSVALQAAAVVCLAWVTNGFLFSLAFTNVRYLLGRESSRRFVVSADLVFLVGLSLAFVPYGSLEGTVLTWREMSHATPVLEPIIAVVLAGGIAALGYKRLLTRLLIVGCSINLVFEARLFLFGIRPANQFDWLTVTGRVLFEMNIALMVGFLLLKLVYGLADYKDDALRRG